MRYCLIDFETASSANLKKTGAWRYSEDPSTEILCLGYAIDGLDPVVRTEPQLSFGSVAPGTIRAGVLEQAAQDPDVIFVAHNAWFEKSIWRNIMVPLYDWPDIPDDRWHDIQAVCAMKGLPLKLEKVLKVMGLPPKDMDGNRVTLSLSRPNRKGFFERSPEKLLRVYDYNRGDVVSETALHRRVRGLGSAERLVWLLDQKINERGVRLDLELIGKADGIINQASAPLRKEFDALTGLNPGQRDKVLRWLHDNGCNIPNMKKETVDAYLGTEDFDDDNLSEYIPDDPGSRRINEQTRRALEIRSILGSASIKKLSAMRACVSADGRARGLLQYHGAGPGRWAGRLLQPQNFPRPTLYVDDHAPDQQTLIDALRTGDAEWVRTLYGEPINVVASSLRHILVPGRGRGFAVGDFAKIECVVVLAMAGATDTAKRVIELGSAVYTDMATKVFKRPITKSMLKEYTIGKNAVLGAGFQMGWETFKRRYWKDGEDSAVKETIRIYREDFAPQVPKMWRGLEAASNRTMETGRPHEAFGCVYALEDGWMTVRLPSGRKLWYRDPARVRKAMPWDKTDVRWGWSYSAWKLGKWVRVSAYGGLLTENVVQATARDLLVNGLFNCEKNNYPVVLTVHDEIVSETEGPDAKLLEQLMTDRPDWARALQIPVAAECWAGDRYRK